jgi:predicted DNA-binding transcriptional regulator YafY
MEILSQGDNVKVIEPQSLIDKIKDIYHNAVKHYCIC